MAAAAPVIHPGCKEKTWPPAEFPSCACPTCQPSEPRPSIVMPASPANPWASHWGYSCTDSPKGDFGFFDKAENEDDLGGIGENGEHCAGRVRFAGAPKPKPKKKKGKSHKEASFSTPCSFPTCTHKCPCNRNPQDPFPFFPSSAYPLPPAGGGIFPRNCIGGFHNNCLGHLCTGSDKTCFYCKRRKDKEETQKEKERRRRESYCHCHVSSSCPFGLELVGRHHCITCLDCQQDRKFTLK